MSKQSNEKSAKKTVSKPSKYVSFFNMTCTSDADLNHLYEIGKNSDTRLKQYEARIKAKQRMQK
jgi:hypothetical protein